MTGPRTGNFTAMRNWKPKPYGVAFADKIASHKADHGNTKVCVPPPPPPKPPEPPPEPPAPTPNAETARVVYREHFDRIQYAVCHRLSVDASLLLTNSRHPRVTAARRVIVTLCRIHTLLSYPEIQILMQQSNHSSTITQGHRTQQMMDLPMFAGAETYRQCIAAFDNETWSFKR